MPFGTNIKNEDLIFYAGDAEFLKEEFRQQLEVVGQSGGLLGVRKSSKKAFDTRSLLKEKEFWTDDCRRDLDLVVQAH